MDTYIKKRGNEVGEGNTWSAGRRPGEIDESMSRWFGVKGGTEPPPGGDLSWAVAAAPPRCDPSGTDPTEAPGVFCSRLTRQAATSGGMSPRPDNIDRLTWLAPLGNSRREVMASGSDSIPTPRIWLASSFAGITTSFVMKRLSLWQMKVNVLQASIEDITITCLFTISIATHQKQQGRVFLAFTTLQKLLRVLMGIAAKLTH